MQSSLAKLNLDNSVLAIQGPARLEGTVQASGAKNAALPALAAALLTDEPVTLLGLPEVADVLTLRKILAHLGVKSARRGDATILEAVGAAGRSANPPAGLTAAMRASALVLGPLLARRGRARLPLPGGCAIGARPIDQHLRGFEALGATVRRGTDSRGVSWVELSARQLHGTRFRFACPTVGGTENLLLAACLARGTTVLENCAREPEIVDLACLLGAMGALIEGAGTARITVVGRPFLQGAKHRVMPDRIEAGTYLIGAALCRGEVTVEGCRAGDLEALLSLLEAMGADVECGEGVGSDAEWVRVRAHGELRSVAFETAPHPGFPTDLQAPLGALATSLRGSTSIHETLFENRFRHVPELVRMGASARLDGARVRFHGAVQLVGTDVTATDLRAAAALVLAGLAAQGETRVGGLTHLIRGYADLPRKLSRLGARIEIRDPQMFAALRQIPVEEADRASVRLILANEHKL